MFVRQKNNKSGVISVQVIDKSSGKYKVVKTIGSSSAITVVKKMVEEAVLWMQQHSGLVEFDFTQTDVLFEQFINHIQQIKIVGIDLLLGKIFNEIGFNAIKDELFKKLVLARLCYPLSKLKTVDYLRRYENFETNETAIYRYLDKLNTTQKRTVQKISYQHTLQILHHQIQIVFYDVTTLYFEVEAEDALRTTGFSKDGKHQNPQIVLGLLVSKGGYPLAYEIYNGNKFEGDTMLPVINLFRRKYHLKNLVVVADAGLLSNKNITSLQNNGYEYILGARIKNETQTITSKILGLALKNGESEVIQKDLATQLIISYSAARAKKDNANRERGIKKLEKQIKTGKLTKAQINNKGYNKFLKMSGDIKIAIDKTKIHTDKKWDGLKGYITNTTLNKEEVIENYHHLWQIEKAFRVAKTDIKIRPVYHYAKRRIEAHICIAFVAYKIYKELERKLHLLKSTLSPQKAIEIAKTVYSIKAIKPNSKQLIEKTLLLTDEQKNLFQLFEI
ncbi:MAG: IS1634 family transposase [Parafilimonas sp.]